MKGVNQTEGEFVVVVLAVDWIVPHVSQCVVHPPHVPFKAKSQPIGVGGAGDSRPCSRLFCNGEHARMVAMHLNVELLDEIDCFKIFSTAETIWNPLIGGSAVVEIEH